MAYRHYEKVTISNTNYGIKVECSIPNEKSGQYAIRLESNNIFIYLHGTLIASASAYTMRVRTKTPFDK